ncbi:MAG TPA: carboxypeptidase regulatory-like domain-containing protein, partial [Thermoanaerobaculia bacterium]|nr:carboxypeptidase regulatory-like domain-containing protein [Thermoanaerobaculia bacterium]
IQPVEPEPGISRMIIRPIQARSDGDGYYRLDGIAPGERTMAADREGFRPAVRELEVRAGQNSLDFRLEAGMEVTGRVVDDAGTPVSAARVVLREGFNSWELPSAVSAPDGSFTLSGVSDGTYRIAAEKRGYADSEEGQELTVAGSSVSGVEVKLSTGGAIVGQLSGLDFTELSQVQVWADHEWHPGRVSPDGTYRIENVEPGDRRIVASVRGARQTEGRVTLEAGVREIRLDLEFGEGHVLTGRVTRNGETAQGQALSLDGPGVTGRWAETDHEGRFRFEGLESGTYALTVLNRRGQVHRKESVELTRDRELVIELVTATVAGRVVDSSDKSALSGVQILVSPPEAAESKVFSLELTASTDSRGEFRVPDVPEGSWRVRALLAGYGPAEVSVEIDSNSAPDELEIPLQATEGVTLEVVLASGRPPDSVRAAVLDATGRVVASAGYPTGENGKVRIASVAPGTWELILEANGSAPIAVPVTAPGNAGRVVLPLPGGLHLKVPALIGARTDAKATFVDANGKPLRYPWREARAEHDLDSGSLKLESIAAGTWSVSVTAADGRKWSGAATVVPGTTAELTLE